MPTINVEANLTGRDLLKAVEQLDSSEFQQFLAEVLNLRARRQAPVLNPEESDLLQQINAGLPSDLQRRYESLVDRRRQEALTTEEHEELLRLTNEIEQREAARVAALSELAQLRKTSLTALIAELGLPSSHG
jgi:hypothetical protein